MLLLQRNLHTACIIDGPLPSVYAASCLFHGGISSLCTSQDRTELTRMPFQTQLLYPSSSSSFERRKKKKKSFLTLEKLKPLPGKLSIKYKIAPAFVSKHPSFFFLLLSFFPFFL